LKEPPARRVLYQNAHWTVYAPEAKEKE